MYTRAINRWDSIRNSFWFLPGAMSLGALLLALACTWIDGPLRTWLADQVPWIGVSTSAARATLAAISSATVSIAGIVFSVMLVTLSITSSQYGSRLLRTFMSDTVTQLALGTLVGTSLFAMTALAGIRDRGGTSVANISVIVGLAMAIASLAVLIAFIHHVAKLIQAPNVVAAVAQDLDAAFDRLFPEGVGAPADARHSVPADFTVPDEGSGAPVVSTIEGYLQAIDANTLINLGKSRDLFLRLLVKPGEFVERGQCLLEVWPLEVLTPDARKIEIRESHSHQNGRRTASDFGVEFEAAVNEALIVGPRRTPRQDAECALEELVEVAVRALSPGINDPFTAMSCIDRIAASLGRVAERNPSHPLRFDRDGMPRIFAPVTTFADLMDAAFNQIRQHGCQCVAVAIRMVSAFRRIAAHAQNGEQLESIRLHASMLQRDFRSHVDQPEDGDDFKRRYDTLIQVLT